MNEHEKQVELCVEWILNVPTITNKINKLRTSYGYKHDVERYFHTYISNDAFKEGAKRCGLMVERATELNEFYNISIEKNNKKH